VVAEAGAAPGSASGEGKAAHKGAGRAHSSRTKKQK